MVSLGADNYTKGKDLVTRDQQRAVLLSDRLAVILFVLNTVAGLGMYVVYQEFSSIVVMVLLSSIPYGFVLLLNHLGYFNSSRLLLCLFMPLSTMGITLIANASNSQIEEASFFTSRVILLIAASLPIIIFQLRERVYLFLSLSVSALCLLLYDVVHNILGIGYFQMGFNAAGYSIFTWVVLILYALLVSGFLYYKRVLEKVEQELVQSNQQLNHFNKELDLQHQEIREQTVVLVESQQQLQEANQLIEQQKALLEAENTQLHQHLLEKNKILEASNRELLKHLEEMQHFSYTISHNLRGPVANLLGLSGLFTTEGAHPKNLEVMMHTRTAAVALDMVIRDLSQVLQMRDGKESAESIDLEYLLDSVLLSVEKEQETSKVEIAKHLKAKSLHGVKAYVHSIFYNLINNALKFRHSERVCRLEIYAGEVNGGVLLEVKDNGIGIDLERHGKDIFKMYKRFNELYEGRGLGLYLIKTQAEILGGFVEIQSKAGEGSSFRVWLPHLSSESCNGAETTTSSPETFEHEETKLPNQLI